MSALKSLWNELAETARGGHQSGYLLRLMATHAGCRIFAAQEMPSVLKSVVLAVPKDSIAALELPPDSSAFRCIVAAIEGLGDDQVGIVITLIDPDYEDLFVHLSSDIIGAASRESSPHKAVGAIFRTIERWRRFISRMGLGTLSDDEVQGLIGELSILSRLINLRDERTAVMAWTGPDDAIHDFSLGSTELEVKSHQGNPAGGIWVNDLAQLQPSPSCLLYLIVPRVFPSTPSGLPLPRFIEHLYKQLEGDPSALELFTRKLASIGYLESLSGRYTKNYTIGEISTYRVADGFPAIDPGTMPSAVEKVRYKLRLAPLEPWQVDGKPIIGNSQAPWGDS